MKVKMPTCQLPAKNYINATPDALELEFYRVSETQPARLCAAIWGPAGNGNTRSLLSRSVFSHFRCMSRKRKVAALLYADGYTNCINPSYTASGQIVLIDLPDVTNIVASDFIGLERMTRYGGAIDVSVAEHTGTCVRIAEELGFDTNLALLHDFSELYVGEVPNGFKSALPEFDSMEERWQRRIHEHFGIQFVSGGTTLVDKIALLLEVKHYRHPNVSDITLDLHHFINATAEFLNRFCGDWYDKRASISAFKDGLSRLAG